MISYIFQKRRRKLTKDLKCKLVSEPLVEENMSAHDAGFVYMSENAALDEVFEHYGDVDAFIDSQFKFALGGEEEMYSSIHETHAITRASKMEAQIEDGPASKAAMLNTFDFSFGSDTQINLDRTIPLSPREELQTSRIMCYRCREIVEVNSSACQLSKTTRETPHNLKDGGIELEGKLTYFGYIILFLFVCNSMIMSQYINF